MISQFLISGPVSILEESIHFPGDISDVWIEHFVNRQISISKSLYFVLDEKSNDDEMLFKVLIDIPVVKNVKNDLNC